ncbi:outer membrane protein assembly factor BamB family protein [Actinoplanes awajinensis]|uniref:Pyrrolo-quinoline quinone repeat domain-containing protein n=1 Tax=Actinoplanes awajinensis subsp. mycoplanecinus TaxID=135947 RepID=A0A101JKP1_9ACTN|nr:PQQ-binding-like beta-propeller repeat protein [Actinoplanes awajinensis]KUL28665.1 hypothetical protein ADL15_31325 [Actinoplanes awajinensis subsp. mycoplanecinus]
MSIDLDELFTELGRQADALSLPEVSVARRLGERRRRRNRAVVAVAAATLLVVAGLGAATLRRDRAPEPILPVSTSVRGLAPIGTPLTVFGSTGDGIFSNAVTAGDRLYFGSGNVGNSTEVIAVDGTTGAKLWSAGKIKGAETNGPIAVGDTLLIADGATLSVRDPATGAERWTVPDAPNGDVVIGAGMLVRVNEAGLSEGYDAVTGRKVWSVPPASPADRPRHSVGMLTGPDPMEDYGRRIHASDGQLAQITLGGAVLLRDMRTGKVVTSVATPVRPKVITDFVAYQGTVVIGDKTDRSSEPFRVLAVDAAGGPARTLYAAASGTLRTVFACGTGRLCVDAEEGALPPGKNESIKAINMADGRILWSVRPTRFSFPLGSRRGRILLGGTNGTTLLDADGRTLYDHRSEYSGSGAEWIDDDNLLWVLKDPVKNVYQLLVIAAADGRQTVLGELPDKDFGGCTWTSEFLACRSGTQLTVSRFVR